MEKRPRSRYRPRHGDAMHGGPWELPRDEAGQAEPRTGAGLKLGAGVAIVNALPPVRAKQEPFKASHVGAPLKQRLDREREREAAFRCGLR